MTPIARQIALYGLAWLTADVPPPPRPNLPLSEMVVMRADYHRRTIITRAIYSHKAHRWFLLHDATPLHWQPQQKERP